MKSKVSEAVNEYMEEMKRLYPDIEVILLPRRKVRVKLLSARNLDEVVDKAAELQTRWIIERDIYIQVSVTSASPIPVNG